MWLDLFAMKCVISLGYFIIVLICKEKSLYSFLRALHAQSSVLNGIIKIHMKK